MLLTICCKWRLLERLESCIIYWYSNKSLGVGLIIRPFSRIIVVGPLGLLLHLAIGSWPNNGARYRFRLVEKDLNP